ncbi:hypothetical protein GUJ93_ZPchr0005g15589 [Zizania palustris]|uniref:Uncharacterized protein n=1 Tax=Zizania palustris TaxID=103762 RepID=A0A8J5S4G8_ZIZPA|nr:hypothetical protein GUJ93_ZPchr0005g15589 [Zizania palustris]
MTQRVRKQAVWRFLLEFTARGQCFCTQAHAWREVSSACVAGRRIKTGGPHGIKATVRHAVSLADHSRA